MNEIQAIERQEIKVMQFEQSDVLRRRRLKRQILKRHLYSELMYRKVMAIGRVIIGTLLGAVAGEIIAASILL